MHVLFLPMSRNCFFNFLHCMGLGRRVVLCTRALAVDKATEEMETEDRSKSWGSNAGSRWSSSLLLLLLLDIEGNDCDEYRWCSKYPWRGKARLPRMSISQFGSNCSRRLDDSILDWLSDWVIELVDIWRIVASEVFGCSVCIVL